MLKVDLSGVEKFLEQDLPDFAGAASAHRALEEGTGLGAEFTGWLTLPSLIKSTELKQIISAANKIRSRSKVLVVVGIGGSYLGSKAAIEFLRPVVKDEDTKVIFLGNGLSPDYLSAVLDLLEDVDFDVNVISKSGTTLEPALVFRAVKTLLEKKYGNNAKKHIFATTDPEKGALYNMAVSEGWERFIIPQNVGGRYSVLSAVGLLPMAVAGIDVTKLINAAIKMFESLKLQSPENPAWQYAATRQLLYAKGFSIELLAYYEPSLRSMAEWWKQLFGESDGKNGIGIFPASLEFTADLHSMGQYIQDGPRMMMETVVSINDFSSSVTVPFSMGNPDGLNYLAGREFSDICHTTAQAVKQAHILGGVPNIGISIDGRNEESFAELVCFFELACAISAYMSGVNPFNQPGVEAYKANMFKLLGKDE